MLDGFGQTAVGLFFMVTSLLFTAKATSARIDWTRFGIARVARLAPLHTLVVVVVFGIAFFHAGQRWVEPPLTILMEFLAWVTFSIVGRPEVNGMPFTWTTVAGVTWSLKYEVAFYILAVPALYWLSKRCDAKTLLALMTVVLVALLVVLMPMSGVGSARQIAHLAQFAGGTVVACALRIPATRRCIEHAGLRWLALPFGAVLLMVADPYTASTVVLEIIVFAAVAGGGSLNGLLLTRPALWLGDISYGIYLLHGLILWSMLSICRHLQGGALSLSFGSFCLVMLGTVPLVVVVAGASFRWLEKPAIRWAQSHALSNRKEPVTSVA